MSSARQRIQKALDRYRANEPALTESAIRDLKAQVRLEQLIARSLRTARCQYRGGTEYLFRCPWHPDEHPSLQVNLQKQKFFCHPCGLSGDAIDWVRKFYGLKWSDALRWVQGHVRRIQRYGATDVRWNDALRTHVLDAEVIPRPRAIRPLDRSSRRRWIPYTYYNADGRPQYQVVRTPDKQFLMRHRGPTGAWTWGGGGVPRYLYHLHLLQGLPMTFIVEGEKDADALWKIKLPATTNPGGAGKWRDAYAQQLVDAGIQRVVILPDNDRVGRDHARAVRASCREHGMRARIVRLPGLPPKGDVSDYLAEGHSRADLWGYLNKW